MLLQCSLVVVRSDCLSASLHLSQFYHHLNYQGVILAKIFDYHSKYIVLCNTRLNIDPGWPCTRSII